MTGDAAAAPTAPGSTVRACRLTSIDTSPFDQPGLLHRSRWHAGGKTRPTASLLAELSLSTACWCPVPKTNFVIPGPPKAEPGIHFCFAHVARIRMDDPLRC